MEKVRRLQAHGRGKRPQEERSEKEEGRERERDLRAQLTVEGRTGRGVGAHGPGAAALVPRGVPPLGAVTHLDLFPLLHRVSHVPKAARVVRRGGGRGGWGEMGTNGHGMAKADRAMACGRRPWAREVRRAKIYRRWSASSAG